MVKKKDWAEFRSTGLLLIINTILHAFGWAIVFEYEEDKETIANVYPARVKFRGFENNSISRSYLKIAEYMHEHSEELLEEARE